jgi:hypothetical protein
MGEQEQTFSNFVSIVRRTTGKMVPLIGQTASHNAALAIDLISN